MSKRNRYFNNKIRVLVFSIFFCFFLGHSFAQQPAKDIHWDEVKGILSFIIPKDSRVRIRVGSARGPVYRTLVNQEERKAGRNEFSWDSRDGSGAIDFKKYGAPHFCVDTLPAQAKDMELLVSLPRGLGKAEIADAQPLQKPFFKITQPVFSLSVDVSSAQREWFCKEGVEVMAFLDNRLIRLERVKSLPYAFNLNLKDFSDGEHLLTLNAWTADHSAVAYHNLIISSEIKRADAPSHAGGSLKSLTGKMAYCRYTDNFWQVWIAGLDGSNPRKLTKSPVDKRYPSLSSDGKQIAFADNNGILWVMDSNGKNIHTVPLPVNCSEPKWAPGGKKILFVSYQDVYHGDTKIWEVDLRILKLKKLTSRPWLQYNPCYSPDGTSLVFTDGPELYAQDIRKLNLGNGDVVQLTDNKLYDYDMQPSYFSNGELIAYSSNQDGNYDIWLMDKFGQDRRDLTRNPAHDITPQPSCDGKWIYFLSNRTGFFEVWRMDVNGDNLEQVSATKSDKRDLSIYSELK